MTGVLSAVVVNLAHAWLCFCGRRRWRVKLRKFLWSNQALNGKRSRAGCVFGLAWNDWSSWAELIEDRSIDSLSLMEATHAAHCLAHQAREIWWASLFYMYEEVLKWIQFIPRKTQHLPHIAHDARWPRSYKMQLTSKWHWYSRSVYTSLQKSNIQSYISSDTALSSSRGLLPKLRHLGSFRYSTVLSLPTLKATIL